MAADLPYLLFFINKKSPVKLINQLTGLTLYAVAFTHT